MKYLNPNLYKFTSFFLRLLLAIFINNFLLVNKVYAWSGYDFDNKTEVNIGPGNLVREGSVIEFYDSSDNNYHTAKVELVQSSGVETEVNIIDLDIKKKRTLIMY